NQSDNTLSPFLVGDTNYRDLPHRVVQQQDALYFGRVDVLSARDDQVISPVEYIQVAIFVHPADVARAEPAVHHLRSSCARVVVVAGHDYWSAHLDLALRPGGELLRRSVGNSDS